MSVSTSTPGATAAPPAGVSAARRALRAAYLGVVLLGGLAAVAVAGGPGGWLRAHDPLARFLVAVTLSLLVCHSLGAVAVRLGQPAVTGEVLGAVALGPSLFGLLWPAGHAWVFTPAVVQGVNTVAQLGLALFMFLLGCDLTVVGRPRAVAYVVVGAMGLPFGAGILVALAGRGTLSGTGGTTGYLLVVGLALSITAVPVLARIVVDLGIEGSRAGALALATAAIGDGVAWLTVALILIVAGAPVGGVSMFAQLTAVGLLGAAALVIRRVARAVLHRLDSRDERLVAPVLLAGGTALAALTQFMGLHLAIGAFLFGAMLPRGSAVLRRMGEQLRTYAIMVLLPLLFVSLGQIVSVPLLSGSLTRWAVFAGLLAAAIGGKFAGAAVGGRLAGLSGRDLGRLGALLNCRGVTELVVASIAYESHLVNLVGLTMFVLVALLTTLLTAPLLRAFGLPVADVPAPPAVTARAPAAAATPAQGPAQSPAQGPVRAPAEAALVQDAGDGGRG